MNFDLCKNKYFHISEGNMNLEVYVTSNHLVYGLKTLTFASKKEASNFLNLLFTNMKNAYDEKMSKKKARKLVSDMLDGVFH